MKEATKQDRPLMNTSQSQCVKCWRIFSADGVCEQHKPYAGKQGRVSEKTECTPPQELGMTPIERDDGIAVWGFITEEEQNNRVERMQKARAARKAK